MSQIVDWFVNRSKQYDGFLKMAARTTPKQLMLVEAPAEMGKTWLIQRLRHECSTQKWLVALVDFRDKRAWDYLAIVRQARDQLGAAHFNELTQVINASTSINLQVTERALAKEVNIQLATNSGQIQGSHVQVGDVAGGNIIKDNFFFVQADSAPIRQAIEARITDTFLDCLKRLSAEQVIVLLLDSYEDVTTEAAQWLQASFLTQVRDGLLPKVIVVMAGRTLPTLDEAWRSTVARTGLDLFQSEHVAEYIKLRGLTDLDLATVLRTSGGYPGLLAKMADVATIKTSNDKDWL